MFPHMKAHLHFGETTVTYRYSLGLCNEECEGDSIAYSKKQYNWSDATFQSINWNVHGKAIRSQRIYKTHITKLILNDILPTNKVQHQWDAAHNPNYPQCKLETETRDHILRCTEETAGWRIQFHQRVRRLCERINTHPGWTSALQRGSQAWFMGNEHMTDDGYSDEFGV